MRKNNVVTSNRFLLFSLGGDLFGAPLLSVREVIEPCPIKILPNTVASFLGVINLRGEIIGVMDLRIRFHREARKLATNALMVFETDIGAIAAMVDQVESVSPIADNDIDPNPHVIVDVAQDYLIGVAKVDKRLVTVIELAHVLSTEEIKNIYGAKLLKTH